MPYRKYGGYFAPSCTLLRVRITGESTRLTQHNEERGTKQTEWRNMEEVDGKEGMNKRYKE